MSLKFVKYAIKIAKYGIEICKIWQNIYNIFVKFLSKYNIKKLLKKADIAIGFLFNYY